MNELPPVTLAALLIGRVVPFGPNGECSAIGKHSVDRALRLTVAGFDGDEQGDTRHHGGAAKAVHHYPAEHYAAWRQAHPELDPRSLCAGGFGENFSTTGMTEDNVCVGDIFRIGSALVQVSQARQPCWKLNLRFGSSSMSSFVQASGRTGWYYRVMEPGEVAPGDQLRLIERPHPEWTLARLLHYLYAEPLNHEALKGMAALPVLPSSWRELAQKRLESGRVEDWRLRLSTPEVRAAAPLDTQEQGIAAPGSEIRRA